MKTRWTRGRLAAAAAMAAVLALLGWAFFGGGGRAASPAFVTEHVDRGAIAATVTATGVVEPTLTVQVGTYVSGPVLALYADFNSVVKKGDVVAKIDPATFEMQVRQAEATLADARAGTEKAKADLDRKVLSLKRSRELRTKDFLSQDLLDAAVSDEAQARAQVALQEAGVKKATAALDQAQVQLGYTDIRSPVDGVVISRSVDVGQTVAASFQTPTLFQIADDLTRMQVRASVSESDIGGLAEGQPATFTVDAWSGRPFTGTVSQVRSAPVNVQNVVTYDVIIRVGNKDGALRPGMTATVAITTARNDDAVRVPLRALRFRPEEASAAAAPAPAASGAKPPAPAIGAETPSAYVLAEGELRKVELETGIRDEKYAEVLGGLAPGDTVVVAYTRAEAPASSAPQSPFQPRRFR